MANMFLQFENMYMHQPIKMEDDQSSSSSSASSPTRSGCFSSNNGLVLRPDAFLNGYSDEDLNEEIKPLSEAANLDDAEALWKGIACDETFLNKILDVATPLILDRMPPIDQLFLSDIKASLPSPPTDDLIQQTAWPSLVSPSMSFDDTNQVFIHHDCMWTGLCAGREHNLEDGCGSPFKCSPTGSENCACKFNANNGTCTSQSSKTLSPISAILSPKKIIPNNTTYSNSTRMVTQIKNERFSPNFVNQSIGSDRVCRAARNLSSFDASTTTAPFVPQTPPMSDDDGDEHKLTKRTLGGSSGQYQRGKIDSYQRYQQEQYQQKHKLQTRATMPAGVADGQTCCALRDVQPHTPADVAAMLNPNGDCVGNGNAMPPVTATNNNSNNKANTQQINNNKSSSIRKTKADVTKNTATNTKTYQLLHDAIFETIIGHNNSDLSDYFKDEATADIDGLLDDASFDDIDDELLDQVDTDLIQPVAEKRIKRAVETKSALDLDTANGSFIIDDHNLTVDVKIEANENYENLQNANNSEIEQETLRMIQLRAYHCDHNYTKAATIPNAASLGINTPSDSEEDIDVVSLDDGLTVTMNNCFNNSGSQSFGNRRFPHDKAAGILDTTIFSGGQYRFNRVGDLEGHSAIGLPTNPSRHAKDHLQRTMQHRFPTADQQKTNSHSSSKRPTPAQPQRRIKTILPLVRINENTSATKNPIVPLPNLNGSTKNTKISRNNSKANQILPPTIGEMEINQKPRAGKRGRKPGGASTASKGNASAKKRIQISREDKDPNYCIGGKEKNNTRQTGQRQQVRRTNTRQHYLPSERRIWHNSLERERRVTLKNLFYNLKRVLPPPTNRPRTAKVEILRVGALCCREETMIYQSLKQEEDALRKQQEQLRAQLFQLRRNLAANR